MNSESLHLEYKRELTDDVKYAVIAFANTDGGVLLIGVDDDGGVIGIDNPDESTLKIQNILRDSIIPDVMPFVQCSIIQRGGKRVLSVDVRRGSRRPYFLKSKGMRPEGVYVRQGPSSVPASYDAIRGMLMETSGRDFESGVSFQQNLTFSYVSRIFQEKELHFGDAQKRTLGLINDDGLYTNLAMLLSEQCSYSAKAAVYPSSDSKLNFLDRQEFSGSLLEQCGSILRFLSKWNAVRSEITRLYRTDHFDYPEIALREGVLNALVHREYESSAPTIINVFDDRIELLNPGGLMPKTTLEDLRLGLSNPRNKRLAAVFYRLGLIESYGTGLSKIYGAYKDCPKTPEILTGPSSFRLTLPNRNAAIDALGPGDSARSGPPKAPQSTVNGQPIQPAALTGAETTVLQICKDKGEASRAELQQAISRSLSTTTNLLNKMLTKGILVRVGSGPKTRYRLPS